MGQFWPFLTTFGPFLFPRPLPRRARSRRPAKAALHRGGWTCQKKCDLFHYSIGLEPVGSVHFRRDRARRGKGRGCKNSSGPFRAPCAARSIPPPPLWSTRLKTVQSDRILGKKQVTLIWPVELRAILTHFEPFWATVTHFEAFWSPVGAFRALLSTVWPILSPFQAL